MLLPLPPQREPCSAASTCVVSTSPGLSCANASREEASICGPFCEKMECPLVPRVQASGFAPRAASACLPVKLSLPKKLSSVRALPTTAMTQTHNGSLAFVASSTMSPSAPITGSALQCHDSSSTELSVHFRDSRVHIALRQWFLSGVWQRLQEGLEFEINLAFR